MDELPELDPEAFEILVVRELRKVGFDVGKLRLHRRATLVEPERGYLRELRGVVSRASWQESVLIACRRQELPIGRGAVDAFKDHLKEAGVAAGILFGSPTFEPEAVQAAEHGRVALLRVTDGRTAFDTSGWGTAGHYPVWLPAYCAQLVKRDGTGRPQYALLASGQGEGDAIVALLRTDTGPQPPGADLGKTSR